MKWLKVFCIAGFATAVSASTLAADGGQILSSQCASCHALSKPENVGVDHIWEREGPDLYYAGNKFQRDWLVEWLQSPKAIRTGGEFYRKHVKSTPDGDVIDSTGVAAHPALDKASAEATADALLKLTVPGLVETGVFKNAAVSPTMGAMFFGKLRGCSSCHQDAPGKGGSSGPELYTANKRLQADYVYGYTQDPQKFDPRVWMPKTEMKDPDLQRLTGYIMQLKVGAAP